MDHFAIFSSSSFNNVIIIITVVFCRIQKLELKKDKTETELQELEHLKAENSRIK